MPSYPPLLLPFVGLVVFHTLVATVSPFARAPWVLLVFALTGVAVVRCWKKRPGVALSARSATEAILVGVVTTALWIAVLRDSTQGPAAQAVYSVLPAGWRDAWLVLRAVGYVVVTPFAEEMAFRGYLVPALRQRFAGHRWTDTVALGGSALVFGALHSSVLAGIVAGTLFGFVFLRTGSLAAAVLAHSTANMLLLVAAALTGQWRYWS